MLTINLKYIIYILLLLSGISLITYIILNEKSKAKLQLEKQISDISKATNEKSLEVQKNVTKNYINAIDKKKSIEINKTNKNNYINKSNKELNEILNSKINYLNKKLC